MFYFSHPTLASTGTCGGSFNQPDKGNIAFQNMWSTFSRDEKMALMRFLGPSLDIKFTMIQLSVLSGDLDVSEGYDGIESIVFQLSGATYTAKAGILPDTKEWLESFLKDLRSFIVSEGDPDQELINRLDSIEKNHRGAHTTI